MIMKVRISRRAKRTAGLLSAVLALAAFSSSAAYAAPFQSTPTQWYYGIAPLGVGQPKPMAASAPAGFTLTTSLAGKQWKFSASGSECVGCNIENVTVAGHVHAVFHGVLRLTGMKLVEPEPANCHIPSTLETKAITGEVGIEEGSSSRTALLIRPSEGETFFTIEFAGGTCGIQGVYKFGGTIYAEGVNARGVMAVTQPFTFSEAIQKSFAGSGSTFKFGANPAYFTGTLKTILVPEHSFGAKS